MGTLRSAQDAHQSSAGPPARRTPRCAGMRFGEIFKSTEKYKRVEDKFDQHVASALERQDEEDRKRRKVEQEKTEAAGTLDARESELMEETREKRPAEEEVERANKRSRPGELEETREKRPAEEEVERDNKRSRPGERRDNSMEVDGLDGEEIEEDELHSASLEADADEDLSGEEVGDPEFEEEFRDNRTGEYLDPELVAEFMAITSKDKAQSRHCI